MRFSKNAKKWVSVLMTACLALPLVGCSPEASTTTTKPSTTGAAGKSTKEQTGTSLGDSSIDKGREVPEPDPADQSAGEKAGSEKPNE